MKLSRRKAFWEQALHESRSWDFPLLVFRGGSSPTGAQSGLASVAVGAVIVLLSLFGRKLSDDPTVFNVGIPTGSALMVFGVQRILRTKRRRLPPGGMQ